MHWAWKINNKMEKIIISCVIFFCLHRVSWASKNNMPKDLHEYIKKLNIVNILQVNGIAICLMKESDY